MKIHPLTIALTFLAACFVSSFSSVIGQSTVFNIPSSDVQAPGKVYIEADFITHFASYANGGYQSSQRPPGFEIVNRADTQVRFYNN